MYMKLYTQFKSEKKKKKIRKSELETPLPLDTLMKTHL